MNRRDFLAGSGGLAATTILGAKPSRRQQLLDDPDGALPPIKIRRPHAKQKPMVFARKKRIMVRAGRRSGKTTGLAIRALHDFFTALIDWFNGGAGVGGRVLYAAPTADQTDRFWAEIRRAVAPWVDAGLLRQNATKREIEVHPALVARCTSLKYEPRMRIRAQTAWNADSLRGDFDDLLIFDEWQLMNESAWEDVGAPMLLDTNGDAIFLYTPPNLNSKSVSKANDKMHAAKMFKAKKKDPRYFCTHFTSKDNPYLSAAAFDEIVQDMSDLSYRLEILAEDVDEAPGALWKRAMFKGEQRHNPDWKHLVRIVVGVDPMGTREGSECGIIVAGIDSAGRGYVLEDLSDAGLSPAQWAGIVIDAYDRYKADRVVAEVNYGGDMVKSTIETVNEKQGAQRDIAVRMVTASRGKNVRAEPVAALYEKKRVYHAKPFETLEDQLCLWTPMDKDWSPDRLDALVWACTDLMLGPGAEPVSARRQPRREAVDGASGGGRRRRRRRGGM